MDNPTPTISNLISRDYTIKTAIGLIIGPLVLQAISFATTGQVFAPFALILGIFVIVGIVTLLHRYMIIMTTFHEGITIRGKVVRTEKVLRRSKKRANRRSYFATVSYHVCGETHETRIRLPGEPDLYGISEGFDVDILVKEEKPKTVFIKKLYLD